jgi:hypothetical protein
MVAIVDMCAVDVGARATAQVMHPDSAAIPLNLAVLPGYGQKARVDVGVMTASNH